MPRSRGARERRGEAGAGACPIYSKSPQYDGVTSCVKDWVTQVNSDHRDRMTQPKNVQVVSRS